MGKINERMARAILSKYLDEKAAEYLEKDFQNFCLKEGIGLQEISESTIDRYLDSSRLWIDYQVEAAFKDLES